VKLFELFQQPVTLKEGGNVFKDADGTPLSQRINKADVDPTLAWLEKITGMNHRDFKLGTTGIKSSSGDLDIAVDPDEVDKNDLYNVLLNWVKQNHPDDDPRRWVAKSGVSVHFNTPINGNPANGFVQTDLMFGKPEWMKFSMQGSPNEESPFKGMHRHIMMASIAKAKGMSWSFQKGLVNRETKEIITKDPKEIAELLLGPGGDPADFQTVETINAAIKQMPNYEQLVADAKENFARAGLELPQ